MFTHAIPNTAVLFVSASLYCFTVLACLQMMHLLLHHGPPICIQQLLPTAQHSSSRQAICMLFACCAAAISSK